MSLYVKCPLPHLRCRRCLHTHTHTHHDTNRSPSGKFAPMADEPQAAPGARAVASVVGASRWAPKKKDYETGALTFCRPSCGPCSKRDAALLSVHLLRAGRVVGSQRGHVGTARVRFRVCAVGCAYSPSVSALRAPPARAALRARARPFIDGSGLRLTAFRALAAWLVRCGQASAPTWSSWTRAWCALLTRCASPKWPRAPRPTIAVCGY